MTKGITLDLFGLTSLTVKTSSRICKWFLLTQILPMIIEKILESSTNRICTQPIQFSLKVLVSEVF